MMYPNSALIMLSYLSLRMFVAAFFIDVPNMLGGILTTSSRVDIENNCDIFLEFEFMNLWVIHA